LCIHAGGFVNAVTGFLVDSAGTVYVKPMSASLLRTVYQTYWQTTGTGAIYDVAGAHQGGIPGGAVGVVYHAQQSGLATVHVQLRSLENVTPLDSLLESYDGCGSTTLPESAVPDVYTDYRTPGSWNTNLDFGPPLPGPVQRNLYKTATYQAGHTYTDLFGSAVAGSSADYPTIDGHDIIYGPGNLFSDPVVKLGFDCEGQAHVTLLRAGILVSSASLTFCTGQPEFSAHVTKKGWYTLNTAAIRQNPTGPVPGTMLSTEVSMTWRFKFAPVTGHPINAQAVPVTVTRFEPQGLGIGNDAHTGATTTIRFVILRGGGQPVATPRYRLKSVRVQASFNAGLTWQTLTASPHGSYWLTSVSDPASGYVSLRSIVTDTHGDRTTETIIRAYVVHLG